MTDRTLTALYQTRQDAEAARDRLKAAGFNQDVDIHDQGGSDMAGPHGEGGFMEKMKNFFGGHEDTHVYNEGVSRGHYLLTVKVEEMASERAAEIINATDAVDLGRTEDSWRAGGWTAPTAASAEGGVGLTGIPAGNVSTGGYPDASTARADATPYTGAGATTGRTGDEQVIPIVEEQLRVGKREVERGGVKVRTYVVETPVHEQIGLREEHVSIERRAVDRPVSAADTAFQDRNIELTETAEEAVVAKDAVVREEVVVRKDVSQRQEEINDTVRRTEVEIDDTTGRGKSAGTTDLNNPDRSRI